MRYRTAVGDSLRWVVLRRVLIGPRMPRPKVQTSAPVAVVTVKWFFKAGQSDDSGALRPGYKRRAVVRNACKMRSAPGGRL